MSARRHQRAGRGSERGFTLIELLVASIAGLFVVLAAFMLSRGATRLFAAEGRVANSQLNLRLGIDRVRQDLERAGYMTTPNVIDDPDVCPRPASAGLAMPLQSVLLKQGTAATSSSETKASAANGLNPDRITLTGNFASTDIYLAATVLPSTSGAGFDVVLQKGWGSTARLLGGETGTALSNIQAVFAKDRILRIRNSVGVSQYVIIENASLAADGRPVISTKASPTYRIVDSTVTDKRCGGSGFCLGCEVNPVQIVQYFVGSLATHPSGKFAWAYPTGGSVGDTEKYDLVRQELNPDGTVVVDSEEIVAEYAVDLAFAFGVDNTISATPGSAWIEPVLQNLPFGHADNMLYGASVLGGGSRPQRIRSVRYRFTTRTRFPDNNAATDDGGPGLGRYKLATDRYARARTVTGDIALVNQQGIRW